MDLKLKGKTAVICGGSTGIGAAAALQFAQEGCRVAVCGRSEKKLEEFRQMMEKNGVTDYLTEQVDAIDPEQVNRFADHVAEDYGRIDIWVNSAGGNKWGPVDTLSHEKFQYIIDLNLTTAFNGVQAAARWMKKNGGGVIINISSKASRVPTAYRIMYGAAKAAVNKMTLGVAAELAPYHIRCNAIAPGVVETALMKKSIQENYEKTVSGNALQRVAQPEEIASMIVCMSSERHGFLTGAVIDMNGGSTTVSSPKAVWTDPWDDSMSN